MWNSVPILTSVLPGLIALAYAIRRRSRSSFLTLVGGGAWLAALALRAPLLLFAQLLEPVPRVIVASSLAGLFEETIRSLILRSGLACRYALEDLTALGIGWGLVEALFVFVIPVMLSPATSSYHWLDLLPGALERNFAIVVHLSLTIFLSRDPKSFKLLAVAVTLHALVNAVGACALLVLQNVWLVELIVGLIALIYSIALVRPTLRYLKM